MRILYSLPFFLHPIKSQNRVITPIENVKNNVSNWKKYARDTIDDTRVAFSEGNRQNVPGPGPVNLRLVVIPLGQCVAFVWLMIFSTISIILHKCKCVD